jgi:hypothetical protein
MSGKEEDDLFEDDPLLKSVGSGKDLWADESADEYVRRLCGDAGFSRHRRRVTTMNSFGAGMNVGDRVIVIGVPADLKDDPQLKTREVFEKCVGRTFEIKGIDEVEGLARPLVRLEVGEVAGQESYMETIWIESEYLRSATD